MAFYKDYSKDKKKKDYGAVGSWDDEGAHYKKPAKGAYVQRSGSPAAGQPGRRPAGTAPAGADSRESRPYGRPAVPKTFRPAGDKPAFRQPREGEEGERRAYGRPAAPQTFRPAGDKPAFRQPREGEEGERRAYGRPAAPRQTFRPAGDKPAFGNGRSEDSGERRGYGRPAPRKEFRPTGDKPAFRPYSGDEGERRTYGRPVPRSDSRIQDKPYEPAYKKYEYKAKPVSEAPAAQEERIDPLENVLSGRNPIREAIKSGRDIEKMLVAKGDLSGSAREIIAMAREARIPVQEVERIRLDEITKNHQGMLAFASAYQYATVESMLVQAREQGEAPFLILLDGITDPHNLGAIIRTAECVGAHGVIVPERRAVGLTPAAVKASAGAVEHVKVARVGNLTRTMEELKQAGLWIAAATTEGEDFRKADLSGPVALVIGAEGEGISRLVLSNCDRQVSLPLKGKIGSLNASVAAGVLMYAVLSGRNKA